MHHHVTVLKAPGHKDSQPIKDMSPGAWGRGSMLASVRRLDDQRGDICFCSLESLLGVVILFLSG